MVALGLVDAYFRFRNLLRKLGLYSFQIYLRDLVTLKDGLDSLIKPRILYSIDSSLSLSD
jgi:hypothetical protein